MPCDFSNSMPMVGEIFKYGRQRPEPLQLSRDLTALLVSGPAGGTDPVLWTLLLQERPEPVTAGEKRDQPRARLSFAGLRACLAVALRAAFARGP